MAVIKQIKGIIPWKFLSFFLMSNWMMQNRTVGTDTSISQLFSQPLPLTDGVHTFYLLSSPGFYWSHSFPVSCPAFTENSSWWLQRACYSLAQSQRCLHFTDGLTQQFAWTNSSQLHGWTSGKPITTTISGMFVLPNTFFGDVSFL